MRESRGSNPRLGVTLYFGDYFNVSFQVMDRDAKLMRQDGPTIFAQAKHMVGIPEIANLILQAREEAVRNLA